MYKTAIIFHPVSFVGFNKIQLIERHLLSSGIIGNRFRTFSAYTSGPEYRQFIPKLDAITRYHYGIIRIYIVALGQWFSNEHHLYMDHANLVVIEGDAFIDSAVHTLKLCAFLKQITGDDYLVDQIPSIGCLGVSEMHAHYC